MSTLKDGGFGDADGTENGIVVDPLAFGSQTNPSGGGSGSSGSSAIDKVFDEIVPGDFSCFITTASDRFNHSRPQGLGREIRDCVLLLICIIIIICNNPAPYQVRHRQKLDMVNFDFPLTAPADYGIDACPWFNNQRDVAAREQPALIPLDSTS